MNTPKKILIIDDQPPMRELLKDYFESDGFAVAGAADGEKGLEAIKRENPDLVMLDIDMPGMDGMAMLKELRKDPWGKNLPVIVFSNMDDNAHVAQAMEGGSFYFLTKNDWNVQDVVKFVKEKLQDL